MCERRGAIQTLAGETDAPLCYPQHTAVKRLLGAVLALLLALAGFLIVAGYFDRDVFVPVPPTATAIPQRARLAAVYVSGDVGYRIAMGSAIGSRLSADGIPVLAINSLAYFRHHRSLAEVTALTAEAIRKALVFGHADKVVLIGHSLGADALQAGLPGLAPALRAKVQAVVLIVPTDTLYLQISPGEMLDWGRPDGSTLPTLRQLDWAPLTCIYGADETSSPCPMLQGRNARPVPLPGGHALDWDMAAIHHAVLAAIDASATRARLQEFQKPLIKRSASGG